MEDELNEARLRQDDELLVLQSIFGSDVVNVGASKCWKMWKPFDVIIHLRPAYSGNTNDFEALVSVDLHVKCAEDYPVKSIPKLALENPKGLSNEDVEKLENMLINKSNELLGSEVVLELCQLAQGFLFENKKPPQGSFHEGMLRQRAAAEYEIKRQRATSEQREREEIAAFQEIRREKLLWKEAENYEKVTLSKRSAFFTSELIHCVDGNERRICFTGPTSTKRLRTSGFYREYTAFIFGTNAEVLVTEWRFIYSLGRKGSSRKADFCIPPLVRKLDVVEEQMLRIMKAKTNDQCLCSYDFFSVERKALSASNVDVRVVIARNLENSDVALSKCSARTLSHPKLFSKLAMHLTSALRILHREHLLHSNLSANTVWMTIDQSFRTSDYHVV